MKINKPKDMKTQTIKKLKQLDACQPAIDWAKKQQSRQQAWQDCERGDWMLWLLGNLSGKPETKSRKKLVYTACQCAKLSLPYVKEGELRPLQAIETAEKYAKGDKNVTLEMVKRATYAADAAAADAAAAAAVAAYAAVAAAAAAAYAADAAAVAADAAVAAAAADAYATYAAVAAAAAADAKKTEVLKQCADIVRQYYPNAPIL